MFDICPEISTLVEHANDCRGHINAADTELRSGDRTGTLEELARARHEIEQLLARLTQISAEECTE